LDPEGIRWMRGFLKTLAAEGRTVLVSSHLLSEMQLLADDVVIIASGRLVRQGPVEAVLGSMAHTTRVRVRTPHIHELVSAVAAYGGRVEPGGDGALLVTGADAPMVGRAALSAGVELHELSTERPDLEGVFLELTSGKGGIR
ncbi:MAG TPA: ABC transporter ATP-binding protein, partial [Micromonospora sp.]